MSRTSKVGALLALILVLLLFGGWSYVYASSSRLASQGPSPNQYVQTTHPTIKASLSATTGVRITSAHVSIDGVAVPARIDYQANGVVADPSFELHEGEHVVEAKLRYVVFMVPKSTDLKWSFTVDTTSPALEANDGRKLFAVAEDSGVLLGYTEPDSTVSVSSAGVSAQVEKAENGTFRAILSDIDSKESLTLISTDPAGNTSKKDMVVAQDKVPPKLKQVSPKNGERLFRTYQISARIVEKQSFVKSAKVFVDGRWVAAQLEGKKLSTPELQGLKDGKHVAQIEVVDGVGHKTVKVVKFRTDSRYIMIDRSSRRLFLYRSGKLWKSYRVAVGRPNFPTPRGEFEITDKRYRPTWVNPNEGWSSGMPARIGPGPGNPLGTRALNISASGIRIHGTYNSGSIGSAASHGCIRMFLRDVEQLFDLVEVGTPVKII